MVVGLPLSPNHNVPPRADNATLSEFCRVAGYRHRHDPVQEAEQGMPMIGFFEHLREQRWDDHRYYHHSRINQSLHLLSATSFLCAYALAFKDPPAAALTGWLVAMVSRQIGHIFFEPKGYDYINDASHEHKEAIKVGYNLRRKLILLSIWALSPLLLLVDPTMLHTVQPHK